MEKIEQQSPWISVKDGLPGLSKDGESEYVLVRYKDFIPEVAKYCTDEYHECPSFREGGKKHVSHWMRPYFNWIKYEITHWMPIPPINN